MVVTPTRTHEPFGLSWLEALAARRPLVVTRVAGPLDHLEDTVHALMVNPCDPQGLAEAMMRLAREKGLAERLAARGRLKAEELSRPRVAARTAQILEQLNRGTGKE